jgi:hypothetical protein
MKRNFQTLVVLYQFLIFASVILQSLTDNWLSPEMRSYLGLESSVLDNAEDAASPSLTMYKLWWAVTLTGLSASVGVVLFRPWGRILFVVVSVVSLLLVPFTELYVDVGWTVMVGSVAAIIEGMIIALMFFSPLRRLFKSSGEI